MENGFNSREPAVLITTDISLAGDRNITKILSFFGLSSPTVMASSAVFNETELMANQARLLCSAEVLLPLVRGLKHSQDLTERLWTPLHSVFVYAGDNYEAFRQLATLLLGNESSVQQELDSDELLVSPDSAEFCGPLSGLRINLTRRANAFALCGNKGNATELISGASGAVFLKIDYLGTPVFLSTSKEIVDIDAPLRGKYFDVRDHFLSAVTIVLYTKWAFAGTCWQAMENNACLVLDDPLLRPSYGYLNYGRLLPLMERNNFSTAIGFIPWNCRRSSPKIARLFREHSNYYSLAIHGCDHTAGEFGTSDRAFLSWKANEALDRMVAHRTRTGIQHDAVMVFPHGLFSNAAMDVLKQSNFMAAVNSNVISVDDKAGTIRIADVWDVAVMRYRTFPVFTRRDPTQGVENFAFDILLGKPCIVVLHHDFCRDGYKHLLEFVDRLNALDCPLSWRGIGDVIRHSCRARKISTDLVQIEMYATELRLENHSDHATRFLVQKGECESSAVQEVRDGSVRIPWNFANGYVTFELKLDSQEARTIMIQFRALPKNTYKREPGFRRFRTMLRRYLSEFRDNYFVTTGSHFRRPID